MGDPRQCRDLLSHVGPSRLTSQKNRDFGAAIGIAGGEQYLCVTAELCDDHPMTHALQPVDEHPAEWCILADHDDGATRS